MSRFLTQLPGLLLFFLPGCDRAVDPKNPEVKVHANLTHRSRLPTLKEIAPYDEALVVNEYSIANILCGQLATDARSVRVARWAVIGGVEQAPLPLDEDEVTSEITLVPFDSVPGLGTVKVRDDLPFDPESPYFLDLSQSLSSDITPRLLRLDYRSNMSLRLQMYWAIRHQLKLVVLGNSHADCAVAGHLFYEEENRVAPVTMSLAPAGSGMALQCLFARDYIAELPNLEWVIWGVSPRIFNDRNVYDRQHDLFTRSPGYLYDKTHREQLWPADSGLPTVTVTELESKFGFGRHHLGWAARSGSRLKIPLDAGEKARIIALARLDRFRKSDTLWKQFETTIDLLTDRGVRILLFTPPCHPLVAEGNTADINGTGHSHYREIVARLETLAIEKPSLDFLDIHQGGRHDFRHEEFANADHLRQSGALRLTADLVKLIERKRRSSKNQTPAPP